MAFEWKQDYTIILVKIGDSLTFINTPAGVYLVASSKILVARK